MKLLYILVFYISCAHQAPREEENLVSLDTALMQAQASYLKGCVDILKDLKIPMAFHGCRDKSIIHIKEIQEIMSRGDDL
jgi:hypothetical protein